MIITAPNLITLSRIAATILMWFLFPAYPFATFPLLLWAILSDGLDGWLARKMGSTSIFGAIFDPVADKVFYFGTLWLFRVHLTIDLIRIAILPEIMLVAIRFMAFAAPLNVNIPATWVGKCKMVFHCATLVFLFFAYFIDSPFFWGLGVILVGCGALLSIASLFSHLEN